MPMISDSSVLKVGDSRSAAPPLSTLENKNEGVSQCAHSLFFMLYILRGGGYAIFLLLWGSSRIMVGK